MRTLRKRWVLRTLRHGHRNVNAPTSEALLLLAPQRDHEAGELFDLVGAQLAPELGHLVALAEQQRVAGVRDHRRDPLRRPASLQIGAVVLALAVEVVAGVAVARRQEVA